MSVRDAGTRSPGPRVIARWVMWMGAVVLATIAMYLVRGSLDKAHITLAFLLLVLGASARGGRALGLAVATLGFLCFDFFFLPPYNTLTITNPLDWLVLVAFLVTSAVATQLLYRATATAEQATQRAIEVDRLAALGAETLNAVDANDALRAIAQVIRNSLGASQCSIYLRALDGNIALVAKSDSADVGGDAPQALGRSARLTDAGSLVDWIMEHGSSAVELDDGTVTVARELGSFARTDDHRWELVHDQPRQPAVRALALPLQVRDHTVGVLRLAWNDATVVTAEQTRLLVALAYYAALGAERARLVETAERAEAERRVESLRSGLLMALSHDLRTPLTTIKGIAHEIMHGADPRRAEVIEVEADLLNALVSDLLDLSRIHAGAVRPSLAVNTVDDLLGAALRRAAGSLANHPVEVETPDADLLAGIFDFTQSLRIVVNLLDNAAKYSPPGSRIDVRARRHGDVLTIDVMDQGAGVPPRERERIFEPFYRPPGTTPDIRGHGLGLSIARGLAEAQGGALLFVPRPGGGSMFTLELPAADAHLLELDSATP